MAELSITLRVPLTRNHFDKDLAAGELVGVMQLCAKHLAPRLGARAHGELPLNDEDGHQVAKYHFEIS